MALTLVLLLLQDPAAEIDRLVRDLGDDRLEVRERAHFRLLQIGEPALSRIERATHSPDAEIRVRASDIFETVGREARERADDADQKAALLLLRRNAKAEKGPGTAASEGARFDLTATRFDDGWIIA